MMKLFNASFNPPILTLLVGFLLSYSINNHFKQRDDFIQKTVFKQSAREEMTKIDLLLTNNILKIQSFENNMENHPIDFKKDRAYLNLVLRPTIFEQLTIVQKQQSQFKNLLQVNTPNTSLPVLSTNYLQTPDIKKLLLDLQKTSGLIATLVHTQEQTPLLSVVLRSRTHRNIFFIFTTPLLNLFNQTQLTDASHIAVSTSDGQLWVVRATDNGIKSITPFNREKAKNNIFDVEMRNSLPQSNMDLSLNFGFSRIKTNYLSPENTAAGLGIVLTLVFSYLFYILIHQNRAAKKLIVSKTLDLEKTAHDLQQALNSKAHFFGKISHEIRTPLNLILGMIDLCNEANTNKVVQNYLKTMHTSGEHLLSMLDDLIELAQVEKNEIKFQERTIYLAQFLGDVAKLAGQDCRHKGLKIYVHFDKSMPACINTDPNRLRQVLLNLLRNACKYTQKGHVILAVQSSESLISNKIKLKFKIIDSGIGIPADKLNKVFDAFFQIENSRTYAEGGVGLGLSIVKDIVKKMHGDVKVESSPGMGSTFTVEFDFNRPDRTNWYEIYRSYDNNKYTAVLLSSNPLLQKTLSSLNSHANIEDIVFITDDFAKVLLLTDPNKKYWIILDPSTANMDLDLLTKTFGRNVFVLGQNTNPQQNSSILYLNDAPFLPYELLTSYGFSSRSRQRRHLSSTSYAEERAPTPITETAAPKENLSIIVADDDPGNIELYKAYFSHSPWSVQYNYDGQEAWHCFEKKLPDLLILDVRMPNMDGFELLEKIRTYERKRNIKHIPVILVTADLLDYTAQTAKTFDEVTLLAKPIKKKLLFETIHNVSVNYR